MHLYKNINDNQFQENRKKYTWNFEARDFSFRQAYFHFKREVSQGKSGVFKL